MPRRLTARDITGNNASQPALDQFRELAYTVTSGGSLGLRSPAEDTEFLNDTSTPRPLYSTEVEDAMAKLNKLNTKNRWLITFDRDDKATFVQSRYGSATQQQAKDEQIAQYKTQNKSDYQEINSILASIACSQARIASMQSLETQPASQPASELSNTHASALGRQAHDEHRCSCYVMRSNMS
jgi:hypothetical protein